MSELDRIREIVTSTGIWVAALNWIVAAADFGFAVHFLMVGEIAGAVTMFAMSIVMVIAGGIIWNFVR